MWSPRLPVTQIDGNVLLVVQWGGWGGGVPLGSRGASFTRLWLDEPSNVMMLTTDVASSGMDVFTSWVWCFQSKTSQMTFSKRLEFFLNCTLYLHVKAPPIYLGEGGSTVKLPMSIPGSSWQFSVLPADSCEQSLTKTSTEIYRGIKWHKFFFSCSVNSTVCPYFFRRRCMCECKCPLWDALQSLQHLFAWPRSICL